MMIHKKAIRGAALTSALLLTFLVGCSSQGDGSTSKDGSGTLYIITQTGGEAKWMAAVTKIFEKKYPNIKVKMDTIAYAQLVAQAASLYTSDGAPDIAYFQTTMPGAAEMYKSGALETVDDVWKTSGLSDAVPAAASDLWSYKGHHFGIVSDTLWTPVVYYNKTLFAKAGIPTPPVQMTDDEWNSIIEKLKSAGVEPLSVGGNDFEAYHLVSAIFQTETTEKEYADALVDTFPNSGVDPKYSSGPMLAALQKVKKWNDDGVFAKGTAALTGGQATSLFEASGAAMWSEGSWGPAVMANNKATIDYGWFLYPSAGEPSKLQLANNSGVVIPAKAKNKVAAKLYLAMLAGVQGQELINGTAGLLSPRDDLSPDANAALPKQTKEALAQQSKLGTVNFWLPDTNVMTAVQTGFAKIITGESTPQQVADEIQRAAKLAHNKP